MSELPAVFEALVNVPGYMPNADQPSVFDTAIEAWEYLARERERDLDSAESPETVDDGEVTAMELMAQGERPYGWADDGTGVVYAATPGYWGSHDLGLAYSVKIWRHSCGGNLNAHTCDACRLISEMEE
jgi:hypothetical protein